MTMTNTNTFMTAEEKQARIEELEKILNAGCKEDCHNCPCYKECEEYAHMAHI